MPSGWRSGALQRGCGIEVPARPQLRRRLALHAACLVSEAGENQNMTLLLGDDLTGDFRTGVTGAA